MRELRGKRVLITGGARGIGLALAKRLARDGATLLLADLDAAALDEASRAIRESGGRAQGFPVDVADPLSIAALREAVHREGGPIDVLVNNAGVVFGGPFLEVPLARHVTTFRVNVEGLVAMTHAFLQDLLDRDDAHLVNVSSASGFLALPHGATYASSKWAVIGFSESIRSELKLSGRANVGVTTVCPSYVSTGLFDGVRPPFLVPLLTPEILADKVARAILAGRPWVREPWMVKLTPFLKGVLPSALFESTARLLGVSTSMITWKGRT
jgi:NAD(P)-dependent dehydrogenase (short-subunit alcohol dehydrogenase family)